MKKTDSQVVLSVEIQQLFRCTSLPVSSFKCTAVLIKSSIDFIDLAVPTLCSGSCVLESGSAWGGVGVPGIQCQSFHSLFQRILWSLECIPVAEADGCGWVPSRGATGSREVCLSVMKPSGDVFLLCIQHCGALVAQHYPKSEPHAAVTTQAPRHGK